MTPVRQRCPSNNRIATALLLPIMLGACGGGNESESAAAVDATSVAAGSALSAEAAIIWTRIATENQAFTVNATQTVRYGSGSTWTLRSITGGGQCTNTFFGNDPLFGIVKECQLASESAAPPPPPPPPPTGITWTRIAGENQAFTVSGTQTVRYGSGSTWIQRTVTNGGQCSNTFFGSDPLFGIVKECQLASSTSAPPPPPPPPPPTGTSAARIANIELAQSLLYPSADPELVLLPNKAVLVKVNATTTNTQQTAPAGALRVETTSGQLVQSIALTAPTAALPDTAPTVPSFANAYTALVPANLVQQGLRLTASLANGQAATTINPRVGGGINMNFVAVPIQIAGTTGQVVAGAGSYVQARMPVVSVGLRVRAAYASRRVAQLPSTNADWSNAFSAVLGELNDLHILEQASDDTYYVGFMPKRTFGLAGIGYVPGNASLTFDVPTSPRAVLETLTHELGHNFSLPHAPCGGPARPDLEYPYANAQLGAPGRYIWGYNAATQAFTDPRRTDIHDIMSYCAGDTFSDYNYRKMQVFQRPSDRALRQAAPASAAGPQELLLVSGQIGNGKAEMTPVKSLFGQARLPVSGPYTLRITTAQGTIDHPFTPKEIDHVSTVQHFAFTIPHPGAVVGMAIIKDGTVLMNNQAKPAGTERAKRLSTERPQVQATQQGGVLRLTWDHTQYPYLTVTHVVGTQRSALAQDLQGGTASLPAAGMPAGGSFEFSLSDGMNTARVMQAR
jgi:Peptidase M66